MAFYGSVSFLYTPVLAQFGTVCTCGADGVDIYGGLHRILRKVLGDLLPQSGHELEEN